MLRRVSGIVFVATLLLSLWTAPAGAVVPYPACALPNCDPTCAIGDGGCTGPDDYEAYLFLPAGVLPNDYSFDAANPTDGDEWLYQGVVSGGPADGIRAGHDVVGAWQTTTGRPDVVVAVIDSGIRWRTADLARKTALNTGELPLPSGCDPSYDCNGDGVVNLSDFAGVACGPGLANTVADRATDDNSILDPGDLIAACSDDVDDDANGYVDDIAGWDFYQDDNDPFDDVDYGHGTGEAGDQVSEADNGASQAGIAPSSMFVPVRAGDSFVGVGTDFAEAVVYAVDRGVDYISEAMGTIAAGPAGQAALDYAYANDIPVIASAADEQAIHHNYPSNYEHVIWVNSSRTPDGLFLEDDGTMFDLQNGCTNHGGKAWVSIGSISCSSEATARAGGITSLLLSHGKNLMDRGLLQPHTPGSQRPFSAEEVRQIYRAASIDVDHTGEGVIPFGSVSDTIDLQLLLSGIGLGVVFESRHFPDGPGWDQFTGYGRPDVPTMLAIAGGDIPPEADLSGSIEWFDFLDPATSVPVVGTAAAERVGNDFDWSLQVGCGVQPGLFWELASGSATTALEDVNFHTWDPAVTAGDCGFDPSATITDPDAHTVTLRLQVTDTNDTLGEDRRTVAIHTDPSAPYPPLDLQGSGESSPKLADVNGDGVLDIVHGNGAGFVNVFDGATGMSISGFPVATDPVPVHEQSAGFQSGAVSAPGEAIVATVAVGDVDAQPGLEIVASTFEGGVYVWDASGARLPGFPVRTNPAFSDPALRDPFNDLDPGFASSPTLADLDSAGTDPALEIIAGSFDGHVYAWRHDASAVTGFPVKLGDPAELSIDPSTKKITPLDGDAERRLAKIVSSPAVGDFDGDGDTEIVVATNEQYDNQGQTFSAPSLIFDTILSLQALIPDLDEFTLSSAGRMYALNHDGSFLPGWPVKVPNLVPGILPVVAEGTPGSPTLADIDGSGTLVAAIFAAAGPVMLYDASGTPILGTTDGAPNALAVDFPGFFPGATQPGFPFVTPGTGSFDAPFFAAVGSGAFGDLDGDHLPEYAAPTLGLRQVVDIAGPASQEFSDHQLTVWEPTDGSLLPAFPRPADDLHFLTSPALGDVSGDGVPDVVAGSGTYLVRAFSDDGSEPAGFPKFTHGWVLGSVAVGDVTGDDHSEVVAATREGRIFVWGTDGQPNAWAVPWQGFGRDAHNTQNLASGVPTAIPACADQRDNDGDGRTDHGVDLGCASPLDASEVLGDLDFDMDVDEDDRDALFARFGASQGEPRFLDPADLDQDGTITFVDYQQWLTARRSFVLPTIPEGCGLLGIEPFVILGLARRLRRAFRRGAHPV